jgi:diaminopimelate decarboxylase
LLVASVVYVKNGEGRDFLILDAAMNDLVRPSDVRRASRHHAR